VSCQNLPQTIDEAVFRCAERDDPVRVVRVDPRDELANGGF
jgi:hypothetical protein